MRCWPAKASVAAAAQWSVEGPRWQLLPAYALTALSLLVWLHRNLGWRGRPPERKWQHLLVAAAANALGALGLAFAAALPMMAPVFSVPPATGPYAIGSLTYHWINAARSAVSDVDPSARRQLMV